MDATSEPDGQGSPGHRAGSDQAAGLVRPRGVRLHVRHPVPAGADSALEAAAASSARRGSGEPLVPPTPGVPPAPPGRPPAAGSSPPRPEAPFALATPPAPPRPPLEGALPALPPATPACAPVPPWLSPAPPPFPPLEPEQANVTPSSREAERNAVTVEPRSHTRIAAIVAWTRVSTTTSQVSGPQIPEAPDARGPASKRVGRGPRFAVPCHHAPTRLSSAPRPRACPPARLRWWRRRANAAPL